MLLDAALLTAVLSPFLPFRDAGSNPDVPTAAQFAGDPAALRRELSRRVRERMSDRADAGMAADPVWGWGGMDGRVWQEAHGTAGQVHLTLILVASCGLPPAGAPVDARLPRPLLLKVL